MTRRPSPTFVLVIGLVCGALAGGMWAVSSTIRNRAAVLAEATSIAKSEPVREEFSWRIARALVPHSAASSATDINQANAIARAAVGTDEFQQAFVAALPQIYDRVVEGSTTTVLLDPALINAAISSAGATPPIGFTLTVGSGDVPDLRKPLDMMLRASAALGAVAILLVGFALAIAPHRGRAVMRIGRWLITVGILAILVFWLLPTVALLPLGGWISVVGIVLATGDWLAVPAAIMTAIGITIVVLGRAGETEERRRNLSVIPTTVGRNPTHPRIS